MTREKAIEEIENRLLEINNGIKRESIRDSWNEVYKKDAISELLYKLNSQGLGELLELCGKACAALKGEKYRAEGIEIEMGCTFDNLFETWKGRNDVDADVKAKSEEALKTCVINTVEIKNLKEKWHIGFTAFMESLISIVNHKAQKNGQNNIVKVSNNGNDQNTFFKEHYSGKDKEGEKYSDIIENIMEGFRKAYGDDNELRSRLTEILYANALSGTAENRDCREGCEVTDGMFDAETEWETSVFNSRLIPAMATYLGEAARNQNEKGVDCQKIILSFIYNNDRQAISFLNRYHTAKAAGKFIELYVKNSDGKNFTESLPKYWDPNGSRPPFAKGIERTVYTYKGKEVYKKDGKWWELISNKPVPESVVDSGAIEGKKVSMKTEEVTFLQALENSDQYACFTSEDDFLDAFGDGSLELTSEDETYWNELRNGEKFATALKNPAGYVILFDKEKYKDLKKIEDFTAEERFKMCTSIQPLESSENKRQKENRYCIEKHSVWDMGHIPKHEYFLMHAIYMLSEDRFGKTKEDKDKNFEKIYQTPEFYEVQTAPYNRGHVGDESWDIDGIIADYIDNKKEIEGLNL